MYNKWNSNFEFSIRGCEVCDRGRMEVLFVGSAASHENYQIFAVEFQWIFLLMQAIICRSQRPRGLRRSYAADRLLAVEIRIPPGVWMFVLYVLYSKDNQKNEVRIKHKERTEKNTAEGMDVSC